MGNQVTYFNSLPTDVNVGMFEYQNTAGHIWAVSSGLITIATPVYYVFGFKTPKTGFNVIAQYGIEKTGDELLIQLTGTVTTYTGATSLLNIFNMNRNVSDVCPYTLTGGISPTVTLAATSFAGDTLVPGISQGNNYASSVQNQGQIIVLKNDTQYCLKISALGASTKFTFRAFLGSI